MDLYFIFLLVTEKSISNGNELNHLTNGIFWPCSFLVDEPASNCSRAQSLGQKFQPGRRPCGSYVQGFVHCAIQTELDWDQRHLLDFSFRSIFPGHGNCVGSTSALFNATEDDTSKNMTFSISLCQTLSMKHCGTMYQKSLSVRSASMLGTRTPERTVLVNNSGSTILCESYRTFFDGCAGVSQPCAIAWTDVSLVSIPRARSHCTHRNRGFRSRHSAHPTCWGQAPFVPPWWRCSLKRKGHKKTEGFLQQRRRWICELPFLILLSGGPQCGQTVKVTRG